MQKTSAWCDQDQVLAQLERILQSEQFRKSNRLGRFLTYVVEQTLARNPETIRSYNIAVEVFGKGENFDPGDPYVRNIARLTRQSLARYYAVAGAGDKILIDIPAGNYIATFTFDDKEDTVDNTYSGVSEPAASNSFVNGAEKATDKLKASIGVLPFKFLGSAADDKAVIGDVLASSVTSGLSKSSLLSVISWLSTAKFKDSGCDAYEVSRSLQCNYVLSGSYQCSANRLAITFELADCQTQRVVWSDSMHSTVEKLMTYDSEVINDVVQLTAKFIVKNEVELARLEPLESLGLHTRYISGLQDMHSHNDTCFYRAKDCFDYILERYPDYATIKALLAQWRVLKLNRSGGWKSIDDSHGCVVAESLLQSALDSNPTNPLALTMLGLVMTQFKMNPEKGLELYDLAERYNPNEPVLLTYKAAALSYIGQSASAIRYAEKAIALSPFDPQMGLFHTCAAAAYYNAGECGNAERHAEIAFKMNPSHTSALRTLVAIKVDLGKEKEARSKAMELLSLDPEFTTSSYLTKSPSAGYLSCKRMVESLERAGVPAV